MTIRICRQFWEEDDGQDLIEYSLLLGFAALCALGLLSNVSTTTSKLWSVLNVGLSSAQTAAS